VRVRRLPRLSAPGASERAVDATISRSDLEKVGGCVNRLEMGAGPGPPESPRAGGSGARILRT
jgi:hypothetical protein